MKVIHFAVGVAISAAAVFPVSAAPVAVPFWTPVPVRLTQDVTSHSAVQGQMAAAEIAEDVMVGDRVVLHKGMPVWAEISYLKKRRSFGVPGHIAVRTRFAPIPGGDALRLRGSIDAKGAEGGPALAVAFIALGVSGMAAVTGRSGDIPAGTVFLAHIDEERSIDLPLASGTIAATTPTGRAGRR